MQRSIDDKLIKLRQERQSIDEEIRRVKPELEKVPF